MFVVSFELCVISSLKGIAHPKNFNSVFFVVVFLSCDVPNQYGIYLLLQTTKEEILINVRVAPSQRIAVDSDSLSRLKKNL